MLSIDFTWRQKVNWPLVGTWTVPGLPSSKLDDKIPRFSEYLPSHSSQPILTEYITSNLQHSQIPRAQSPSSRSSSPLSAIFFLVFWNRSSIRTTSYMSGNFWREEYFRKNLIVAFPLFRWDIKFLWAEKKFPNGQSWTKLAGVWRSFRGFWQTCNEGIRKLLKVFEAR